MLVCSSSRQQFDWHASLLFDPVNSSIPERNISGPKWVDWNDSSRCLYIHNPDDIASRKHTWQICSFHTRPAAAAAHSWLLSLCDKQGQNKLSGTIYSSISGMDNLIVLRLSDNQLTGDASIPALCQITHSSTSCNFPHTYCTEPLTVVTVHDPV